MTSTIPNPLLEESTLPYSLPAFSKVLPEHFLPAFEAGAAQELSQIENIVQDPESATFENTILELEQSGPILNRTIKLFHNLISSLAGPELREIEAVLSPKLTAHHDEIQLNPALFQRVRAVHEQRAQLCPDAESIRLVERYYLDFLRSGAALNEEQATELKDLNRRLSVLSTSFHQNLQADTEARAVIVDTAAELAGLSSQDVEAAAQAATDRGHDGKYLLTLILPTGQPILPRLDDRQLRQRVHQASVGRAGEGTYNNGPIAIEMAQLRARRANLLGYATHADYIAADGTAKTLANIDVLLTQLVAPAVANANKEAEVLREFAAKDGVELAAWDWLYYSEKVRAARFAVDTEALRPYFELNRVLQDGVFFAAEAVYGVTFQPREDLVGYHPDVRVFEVMDSDGHPLGLFLGDFFARETKRGGAWMNSLVDQSKLLNRRPIILNTLNVTKPVPGEAALLTLDEVGTLFHEFGHALHGLFSDVGYPRFSGTSVPRDFVEFPSQVNEMWQFWPEVVANYAQHTQTGEPLAAEIVQKVIDAQLWGEGFSTTEYLGATLLDQAWHRITVDTEISDAQEFEEQALRAAGLELELVPPRYRSTYFQHIFSGGYSAGYYSYIWAEVLDADTVDWFKSHGGMTRANGDTFREKLLSVGGSVDAMEAVVSILGRQPVIQPLLIRRGLAGPAR